MCSLILVLFIGTRCQDSDTLYDDLASLVGEENIRQVQEMVPDEVQEEVQRKFLEIFVLVVESLNNEQAEWFLMKTQELSDLSEISKEVNNESQFDAKILEIIRLVQNNQLDKLKKSFDELNKLKRIYDESKVGAELDEKFLEFVDTMGTYLASAQGAKANMKIKELYHVIKTYLESPEAAGLRQGIKQFVDAIRAYQFPGTDEDVRRFLNQVNTALNIDSNELLEGDSVMVLLNFFVGKGSTTTQATSTQPRSRANQAADEPSENSSLMPGQEDGKWDNEPK